MNEQQIVDYLRARGQGTPPVDFTRSVMAALDSAPAQPSRFSAYLPAFVAVGAAAVVAVLALLIGPGRDIGPAPSSSASPSATSAATPSPSSIPSAGELERAVTEAYARLADSPGVQGVITSNVEEYLASATWFDWRSNGDEVVVTRTDIDVTAPWWTDPDGAPLSVGERVQTTISAAVGDQLYRSENDVWIAEQAPDGPITFWTAVLEGRIPAVGGLPQAPQVDRRDLADGTVVWVLVTRSEDGRAITEWTIGPDGVLESVEIASEQSPTVEHAGSTSATVEFIPVEDPDPIPTPDTTAAPDPDEYGFPEDFPLAPPVPLNAVQLSECPPTSAPFRLSLPDRWWTNTAFEHPEFGEIPACQYFAPTSFDATSLDRDQVFPEGVAIVVNYIDGGCIGSFLATLSARETTVDGHPATVIEYAVGANETDPPGRYEYVVNLAPGVDCETGGRFILAATGVEMAGDYETNKAVLDEMMSTIQIEE